MIGYIHSKFYTIKEKNTVFYSLCVCIVRFYISHLFRAATCLPLPCCRTRRRFLCPSHKEVELWLDCLLVYVLIMTIYAFSICDSVPSPWHWHRVSPDTVRIYVCRERLVLLVLYVRASSNVCVMIWFLSINSNGKRRLCVCVLTTSSSSRQQWQQHYSHYSTISFA